MFGAVTSSPILPTVIHMQESLPLPSQSLLRRKTIIIIKHTSPSQESFQQTPIGHSMSAIRHRSTLLTAMAVAVVACVLLSYGGHAQGPQALEPAPDSLGPNCEDAFFNMTGCLSYVAVGSNDTAPAKSCCPELAGVIDSNPICLCELLAGGAESYGIAIDDDRALELPSICRVNTLPVSVCSEMGIPVTSPTATSPAPSNSGVLPYPGLTPPPTQQNLAARFGVVDAAAAAGVWFVGITAAQIGIF